MKIKMSYSKTGLQLTEGFEGCRLESYQDSTGVWTIGYGHTNGVVQGMRINQLDAIHFLMTDISVAVDYVNQLVTVQLTQPEFDAVVDFAFNLGFRDLAKSTLLKYLNTCQFDLAANEFAKWDRAGGKVVAGLLRRRLAERDLFLEHYA